LTKTKKTGIIGGGAAGMMCAATLLEAPTAAHLEIHLFDKNSKLGVKVAITGGGRCNVTTGVNDMQTLLAKYIRGANFLKPSLSAFSPRQVCQWFVEHGVPLKDEPDGRVFPVSNKGQDVVKVFEQICQDKQVNLHLSEQVLSVVKRNDKYVVNTGKGEFEFDKLIITTGGKAYQETGSTGDGYSLATSLGHTITHLGPSLNSFICEETWCHELAGIDLPHARFSFELRNGEKKTIIGPMIFTHSGISGPAVFTMAAHLTFEEISKANPMRIKLIPKTNAMFADYDAWLVKEIAKDGLKPLSIILMNFVPRRLAEIILKNLDIKIEKGSVLTKSERQKIVNTLCNGLPLTLTGRTPGAEFVTAGGVETDEIDRRTMESKIHKGLYFAGEILNIDGVTGGFNLQAAWATGRAAGKAILSDIIVI
jgi:predicted Rossmann fold flavoprotein